MFYNKILKKKMSFLSDLKQLGGEFKNKLSTQLNEISLSGAIDVIVIQQENGSLASTPFYCKFGKIGVFQTIEKTVEVRINGELNSNFKMVFADNGDAFYINNSFQIIKNDLTKYLQAARALENKLDSNKEPLFFIETSEELQDDFIDEKYINLDQKGSLLFNLTANELRELKLNNGSNEISYAVRTNQGVKVKLANIYLWNHLDRIIISDLDGTVTKSNVLGQVLTRFGRDWSQCDVAELYHKIFKNDYKFVYLSARSISQSESTRSLIDNVKQNNYCLPKGPLLLNPSDLLSSLSSELIFKKSTEFKVNCINNLKTLFKINPFHAGFGNTLQDSMTYKSIGINENFIFIINKSGALNNDTTLTYKELISLVNFAFPNKDSL